MKNKGYARSASGSAMLLALVVLLFAALVGGGLARTAVTGRTTSAKERQLSQAYYVAESGLNDLVSRPNFFGLRSRFFSYNPDTGDFTPVPFVVENVPIVLGDNPDLTFTYEARWLGADGRGDRLFLLQTTGMTPYARAVASAEIVAIPIEELIVDSAFHFGSAIGTPTTAGIPGGGVGNPYLVSHHFHDSDVMVYGPMYFLCDSPPPDGDGAVYMEPDHYTISDDNIFMTENDEILDPVYPDVWSYGPSPHNIPKYVRWPYTWDTIRYDSLPDGAEFPENLADAILLSVGDPRGTAVSVTPSANMTLTVGSPSGGSWDLGNVKLSNVTNKIGRIEGAGYVSITNSPDVTVVTLDLKGPLVLRSENSIVVEGISPSKESVAVPGMSEASVYYSGDYPLVVISEQGSITIGASTSYDVYSGSSAAKNVYCFGSRTILWARHDLVVQGQIRLGPPSRYWPYETLNPDSMVINDSWDGVRDGFEDDDALLILVSRGPRANGADSNMTFHTIEARGMVYAGSKIKVARVRLLGLALIADPYQERLVNDPYSPGNKIPTLGIAQVDLWADIGAVFGSDPDQIDMLVSVVRRIR